MGEIEDIPQGSLEEAFIINSPANTNQEDIFLSTYTFKPLFKGSVTDYMVNEIPDNGVPWKFPSWSSLLYSQPPEPPPITPLPVIDKVISFDYYTAENATSETNNTTTTKKKQFVDSFGFIYDNEEVFAMMSKYLDECNILKGKYSKMEEKTQQLLKYDFNSKLLSNEKRKKFKQRMRKGIPSRYRGEIWKSTTLSPQLQEETALLFQYKDDFLHMLIEDDTVNEIKRRTPHHLLFEDGSVGQTSVFTILKLFDKQNPNIGSSPTLASVIGVLLLHMQEEDAFSVLQRIITKFDMHKLYKPGYPLLYCCYFVHDQLFESWVPRLFSHFVLHGIDASMYSFDWYMCMFVNVLPFPCVVRIFDIFFIEGISILFRVAISILKLMQKTLLSLNADGILEALRDMSNLLIFPEDLMSCALEFSLTSKKMTKLLREFEAKLHPSG